LRPREDIGFIIGAVIVGLVVLMAVASPLIAPYDPNAQSLPDKLLPPGSATSAGKVALLGTDQLGRDILSRLIYGARMSMTVSLSAVIAATMIGVPLGVLCGYYGGALDYVFGRLGDIQLSFPYLLLALLLMALAGSSVSNLILVLGISGWVQYFRLVRGRVLSLRQMTYVEASRALGAPDVHTMLKHIVPNTIPTVVVIATLQVAQFIILESSLSFLGMGLPPVVPSWGGMINEGREFIWQAWWLETFPGIAIALTVSGLGVMGDYLRDRLDPTLKR